MMPQKMYPTDVTDAQYELIRSLLPTPKSGPGKKGRPVCDRRKVINGILYVNTTGCQWRMLPRGVRSLEHGVRLFQAMVQGSHLEAHHEPFAEDGTDTTKGARPIRPQEVLIVRA